MKRKIALSIALIVSALLTACGSGEKEQTENNDALTVYTTVYPLKYLAEEIGGDMIEAKSVYPANADEHSFEPSQKEIIDMAESDLFLYIGYNLEGFVKKAAPILEGEGVKVAAIGEQIELDADSHSEDGHDHAEDGHDDHEGHDHGDVDPHLWLDPNYMIKMAEQVRKELTELLPEQESYFNENYQKTAEKMTRLDTDFKQMVEESDKNEIIVSHAAYGYWEDRYGIEQLAVAGLSSSSEPSQRQLTELLKTAKEHDIQYVLFEQNVPSKLTETIQKEIGAKSLTIHNLSVLTSEDIENGEDYVSLMEHNISTLKKALQ